MGSKHGKKGFTLVELLATIVILGIILVIAVVKIVNAIDTSRRGAYSSTNAMIMSTIKRKATIDSLESSTITPTLYTFTDGVVSPSIEINGVLPDSGTMEINENGQVQIWTKNDRYCALKRFDESEITIFDRDDRLCNIVVEVTLRVNPNGGTYNGVSTETTYSVEPDETQEVGDPEWANHRFDGWAFTADSGTFEDGVFTASISDATLTAEWTEYVALTLVSNGGTLQTFNASYAPGATIVLEEPTKVGYTFTDWTASGTGASVTGSVIKTLTIGSKDTTLTANFDPTIYSISYNLDGGTATGSNPTEYNIESEEITLSNPTKPDHIFTGWTGSNGTTPQTEVTIEAGSIGHKNYTANWTAHPTLTVVWNGGSGQTFSARYAPGTEITLTPPTKSGRVFAYWAVSGTGSSLEDENVLKIGTGNTTLTANFARNVTYTSNSTYQVEATGIYTVKLWGAGTGNGYVAGRILMNAGESYYLYFNVGAGGIGSMYASAGSGATDMRFGGTSVYHRIMVAAGAGGGAYANGNNKGTSGPAGGLTGYGGSSGYGNGTGGKQAEGGASGSGAAYNGGFGTGGSSTTGGGGGGGYWGGGSGGFRYLSDYWYGGGAGGSSYISGHTGCVAMNGNGSVTPKTGCSSGSTNRDCSIHFTNKAFIAGTTTMIDGKSYSWTNVIGGVVSKPAGSSTATITWYSKN